MSKSNEEWGSRIGIILVVASGAIGLGNFLRFPGQAAKFGGYGSVVSTILSVGIVGKAIAKGKRVLHGSLRVGKSN